jgi:hypothetical protein
MPRLPHSFWFDLHNNIWGWVQNMKLHIKAIITIYYLNNIAWIQHVNLVSRDRLPRLLKNYTPEAKGTKEDRWRDFWMCETGTGQKVTQLLDSHMMMMMMMIYSPCISDIDNGICICYEQEPGQLRKYSVWLRAGRPGDRAIGVRSPAEAKDFSSNLCVQTGSGAPPSLLYNGYRGSFPRG